MFVEPKSFFSSSSSSSRNRSITMAHLNLNLNPVNNGYSHPYSYSRNVAFRLLCHASRVGAIIGKSGFLIRTLQEATGARIRILDDTWPDSPDRVILVTAPAAALSFDTELSQAQAALLKVFDRVIDVAAGTEVDDRVVSCRLLAATWQVGAVIGKAGKVVEKIRLDTGCKIRVLSDCSAPSSEEIIELICFGICFDEELLRKFGCGLPNSSKNRVKWQNVIMTLSAEWCHVCSMYPTSSRRPCHIEGQLTSVKKALVAVSRRLQDCPPPDRTKMVGSRHPAVQCETCSAPLESLSNLLLDHRQQWSSALSNRSNGNFSGAPILSAEANRFSDLDPIAFQQEVTFKILCSNDRVGAIIGKGGSVIKSLQNDSGATISFGPLVVDCEDRLVTITASENLESIYSPAQKAVVLVFSKSVETGVEKGLDGSKEESYVTARIVVPSNQVGCLLGKGGAIVSEMRRATGASIRIITNDRIPKCVSAIDQVVEISGQFLNVESALYNATGRLRDQLIINIQNIGGTRSLSSVLADISSPGRLRDPFPFGGRPISAVSHNLNGHLRAPQRVGTISSRGLNDVARGLTSREGGLDLVSGIKTAIVTNTTVQIVVPEDVIGSVYGENGSNLANLRQISGAKVIVSEPLPGTSDRTIVISGTPDETRAAQSLLQAFILNGSS
ncbi:hypothetical protein Fmac_005132 [Flemingia macrophylla]|uniref:K Homology domain-containing protein n=1 Tax=Flemingia macrophylla TaxID=520843 RepID=A0ABD1N7X5_9FABA